jgi:plastocyanin domain-containing protein
MNLPNGDNLWVLLFEIGLVGGIVWYLYLRKSHRKEGDESEIQRIEIKLLGELSPSTVHVKAGLRAQLIIHRFETEPTEELFEIEEFDIYELLPAGHTTIIAFDPIRRGTFPMVLAGEKKAGVIIVE